MSRSTIVFFGVCLLYTILNSAQVATSVKCLVCPNNKLSDCAQTNKDFKTKVKYELANCTACGKLVSWNPSPPVQRAYVGLRKTVRSLEYKYCATKEWLGCYKSESAITTSIECVCDTDECNPASRVQVVGPWTLTVPLLAAAWALLAM